MFSYSPINRQGPFRTRQAHIDQLWKSEHSLTLLWKNGEFIMGNQEPEYFSHDALSHLASSLHVPVYLGAHQNYHYFACAMLTDLPDSPSQNFLNLRQASRITQDFHLGLLFHAQGILNWLKNHPYCSHCGSSTQITQAGHARQCTNTSCQKIHYPKIDPAVIFAIIDKSGSESRILLGRQKHWEANRYSIIAGFVEPGESLEDAVKREALEETGLVVDNVQYYSSQSWPFPDSLMMGFYTECQQTNITLVDQELETANWFEAKQLESSLLSETIKMPFELSISWHLIDRWFNQQTGYSISDIKT